MNQERKKNKKRRIILLLLLMLFTIGLLSTSTYAWFTANRTVNVSEIQVNIASEGGIQVSANGFNWQSLVSTADLLGANVGTGPGVYSAAINQIPSALRPVSSVLKVDDSTDSNPGLMRMFLGTVMTSASDDNNGQFILTAEQSVETHGTTGHFIAFDLFVRSDETPEAPATETQIYMTVSSQIITPDTPDTGIKNSARIAFIKKGTVDIDDTVANIQALNKASYERSDVYLWEPNYDIHTQNGINHALQTYGITTTLAGADAIEYAGINQEIEESVDLLVGAAKSPEEHVTTVTPDLLTKANYTETQTVFTLAKGVTKLRVYMWIEGQDVDCENAASGGNVSFNLQLSLNAS